MTTPAIPGALKLSIAQILLEKVEFRHRSDFLTRTETKPPAGGHAMLTVNVVHDDEGKSAVVRLEIDSTGPDDFYLYKAGYLVIFKYEGDKPENFSERLGATGAKMLHPFLRELVHSLTSRGRFGPVALGPVNFDRQINEATEISQPRKRKKRAKASSRR